MERARLWGVAHPNDVFRGMVGDGIKMERDYYKLGKDTVGSIAYTIYLGVAWAAV